MGTIFIGSVPQKINKSIAYKKSVQLGVKVYHRNWETNNMLGKIFYTNFATKYKFEGRHLWYFKAARPFKRAVSQTFPKQWQKYVSLDSFKNIWDLFERRLYRDHSRRRHKEELETYNSFDI